MNHYDSWLKFTIVPTTKGFFGPPLIQEYLETKVVKLFFIVIFDDKIMKID